MKTGRSRFLLLLIVVVALLLTACSEDDPVEETITGSGTLATETREVSDFDAVKVVGVGIATITVGDTASLTIEAEENILPMLTAEVENGTLILSTKKNTSIETTRNITYAITVKSLTALELTGSAVITANGVAADHFTIDLNGNGHITPIGTTNSLTVELSGNGSVFAFELVADTASVGLTGNGQVEISAQTALDVDLTGNGHVVYTGEPELATNVTGLGDVRRQ